MSRLLAAQRAFLVPAWGRDLLYRRAGAVPSLDIWPAVNKTLADITTGRNLVTFTRASSATYIDSDGAMKVAAVDVPRIDHDPVTGECLGLLIEEQRTNQLRWSEDSSQWLTPVNATLTQNATTAPDGTNTADQMLETTAVGLHSQEATDHVFVAGTAYTYSVFVKSISGRNFEIGFPVGFSTSRFAQFNLATGAVQGTDSGVLATIIAFPNGWYRCIATSTCVTGGGARPANFINNSAFVRSYTGDTSSGIFVWGIQLEVGAPPTSYIRTTTSAATRNADIASITGTNFSSWYNQTEGTVFAEYQQYAAGGSVVNISDNTGSNFINIFTSAAANARGSANVFTSGTNNGQIDSGGTFVANTNTKASYGLSVGSRSFSARGNTVTTSATPTALPTVNRINIGVNQDATSGWNNGTIRRLTYWPRRLPNSILQTLTQ